ncbi:MAG: hypothetical protein IJ899_05710 [Blautia sp.]|nr:hypothetical protein [Blautia sp.]
MSCFDHEFTIKEGDATLIMRSGSNPYTGEKTVQIYVQNDRGKVIMKAPLDMVYEGIARIYKNAHKVGL